MREENLFIVEGKFLLFWLYFDSGLVN